ncbi:DUF7519 family protein [Halovivax limisalsi]|uniref:DUF7519 family protein n=1 Tax=Halovivax limisalsi TaxID=1453760 RepID=UPI001FFD2A34|nr:hypothetical protein [Halovivax limisalsi]
MTDLDRRPTRLASVVSVLAAVCVIGSTLANPVPAAPLAIVAALLVATALSIGSRPVLDVGGLVAIAAVAVGAAGAHPAWPLVGAVAAIVSWDLGGAAIRLGHQVGRAAETTRLELWYVVTSVGVGAGTGTVAYAAYTIAGGGLSLDAAVLLLLAGVLATLALGARFDWGDGGVGVLR